MAKGKEGLLVSLQKNKQPTGNFMVVIVSFNGGKLSFKFDTDAITM